jgi:hypothetical protein
MWFRPVRSCPVHRPEVFGKCVIPHMEDAIEWNFRTLVDGWILYGLPVLLVTVAITVLIRNRSRPTSLARDGVCTVRRIGLIHCALAAQALISLVQVLLTMRTMGIPESHIALIVGLVTTVVNLILAAGLLRFSPVARRFALAWYVLLSMIGVVATGGCTITVFPLIRRNGPSKRRRRCCRFFFSRPC